MPWSKKRTTTDTWLKRNPEEPRGTPQIVRRAHTYRGVTKVFRPINDYVAAASSDQLHFFCKTCNKLKKKDHTGKCPSRIKESAYKKN
jgi:hypothetical protein